MNTTTRPLPPEHPGSGPEAAVAAVEAIADAAAAPPAADTGDAAAVQARAQRLHYLFRRSMQHPHVLKKALFIYREVPLP